MIVTRVVLFGMDKTSANTGEVETGVSIIAVEKGRREPVVVPLTSRNAVRDANGD